jgi:uncharacterized protein (DUF1697 family)
MPAIISMLRGVNLGGHHKISMEELRLVYETLGLEEPKTFIQSGNVVFRSKDQNLPRLAKRIEDAIERKFGFRAEVIQRTASEMKELVMFFSDNFSAEVQAKLVKIETNPEEVRVAGRELYIYFPDGQGRSKLTPVLGRILKNTGTGRNWNTVTKLLAMAESLETSK